MNIKIRKKCKKIVAQKMINIIGICWSDSELSYGLQHANENKKSLQA